jgi:translation initiation factor IF-1
MSEAGVIEMQAKVIEARPRALYTVELSNLARSRVTAHVAGESSLLRLLPGDQVIVALAGYDASRGRIVRRCG